MSRDVEVVFVCWGNICRSPMAERIAQGWARREGVSGVRFTSAGVSAEERGNPIDARAARQLRTGGYDATGHRAHRITAAEITAADQVIAMEGHHVELLRRAAPEATNLALLTDFDPAAKPGTAVPDPWYGGQEGFADTQAALEAAMPAIMARVLQLGARGPRPSSFQVAG